MLISSVAPTTATDTGSTASAVTPATSSSPTNPAGTIQDIVTLSQTAINQLAGGSSPPGSGSGSGTPGPGGTGSGSPGNGGTGSGSGSPGSGASSSGSNTSNSGGSGSSAGSVSGNFGDPSGRFGQHSYEARSAAANTGAGGNADGFGPGPLKLADLVGEAARLSAPVHAQVSAYPGQERALLAKLVGGIPSLAGKESQNTAPEHSVQIRHTFQHPTWEDSQTNHDPVYA